MMFIQTEIDLQLVDCYTCGVRFGVPARLNQNRLDDKGRWYCPNGHSQVYTGLPVRELLAETEHAYRTTLRERDRALADGVRKAEKLAALRRRAKKDK